MAGFEVNGVGAAQGANGNYEVKKQDSKEEYINSSFGQGYGAASGGGQADKPATGVINAYGGEITNFANFKNDKYDALQWTNDAAGDIKKLYMQLQHEFPGIELQFEPMPNPQTVGKKREGFNIYKQQLKDWKDIAMKQIDNARRRNTAEVVGDAVDAVKQNTNEKAAMNAALTAGYGEANLKATEQEGVETRKTVKSDGANTRKAVHSEGAATRRAVHYEGDETRRVVQRDGDETREVVHKEADKTRGANHADNAQTRRAIKTDGDRTRANIQAEADRVIDTLDPAGINRAIKGIRDMATKAGKSVKEFITENPNAIIAVGAGGIPIWAARKITAQM